jgi:nucleotide-binding universal stress UspA family protein
MAANYRTGLEGAIKTLTREGPRMLVAIESERDSRQIIEVAADLAGGLDASVTLLRVVPPPAKPWVWLSDGILPGGGAYFDTLNFGEGADLFEEMAMAVEQVERAALAELRQLEGAFAGLAVSRAVAIDANAGRAIVAWLCRSPHDLVVLAAARRHPLLRLFAATTVEAVVHSRLACVVVAPDCQTIRSNRSVKNGGERDGHQLFLLRSKTHA